MFVSFVQVFFRVNKTLVDFFDKKGIPEYTLFMPPPAPSPLPPPLSYPPKKIASCVV